MLRTCYHSIDIEFTAVQIDHCLKVFVISEPAGSSFNVLDDTVHSFQYRLTNAILEGMNSIIQNVKRRARGFRNNEYFEIMIYLNCSKLDIDAVIASA